MMRAVTQAARQDVAAAAGAANAAACPKISSVARPGAAASGANPGATVGAVGSAGDGVRPLQRSETPKPNESAQSSAPAGESPAPASGSNPDELLGSTASLRRPYRLSAADERLVQQRIQQEVAEGKLVVKEDGRRALPPEAQRPNQR